MYSAQGQNQLQSRRFLANLLCWMTFLPASWMMAQSTQQPPPRPSPSPRKLPPTFRPDDPYEVSAVVTGLQGMDWAMTLASEADSHTHTVSMTTRRSVPYLPGSRNQLAPCQQGPRCFSRRQGVAGLGGNHGVSGRYQRTYWNKTRHRLRSQQQCSYTPESSN